MITIIIVGLVAAVLVMEFVVSPRSSDHLLYKYSFDTQLAEPGEKIVYTEKLMNNWFLPVIYAALAVSLPEGAVIAGTNSNSGAYRLSLLPHRSKRRTLIFTLPKRGVYTGARYFVETGDFLGFRSRVVSCKIPDKITVMPKKCEDEQVIQTLGGYMGDISVRRYIIEDPVLTMGFRDYTGHEPMKKISWTQSARTGRLVVKNNDFTVDVNIAVILNMESGTSEEKEKSLEIVRTVCEKLEEKRIPYQFISNGDLEDRKAGFGRKHFGALMTDLGKSELFSYISFDALIDQCIRERKRDREYIIVSPPLTAENRVSIGRLKKCSDHEPCVLEAEVV
jgi:uncharacterized protein (DUF58 family)